MRRIVLAVFESRSSADAARAALLEQGVHDNQIGIEGGTPVNDVGVSAATSAGSEARGLAGVIARMFSGIFSADDPRTTSYTDAVSRGATLLAVHGLDDDVVARVSAMLLRHGASRVDPHPDGRVAMTGNDPKPVDPELRNELAAVSTVGGPEVYALPNAPTGWRRSTATAEMRVETEDPARPQGELRDAAGLHSAADRAALERAVKRRR